MKLIIKKCSCGKRYFIVPKRAEMNKAGYWWNCNCENTLFTPFKRRKRK